MGDWLGGSANLFFGRLISTSLVIVFVFSTAATGQRTAPVVFNFTAPPGNNYDKAEFRLWHSGAPTSLTSNGSSSTTLEPLAEAARHCLTR